MKPTSILTVSYVILFSTIVIASTQRELSLTVYNDNFALVKDQRAMKFKGGVNEFKFTDVAATIEPSSVRFRSLTDPQARVVEQNFQFDLVGSAKLLEKYIDHPVEVLTAKGEIITGKLLRAEEQQIILQDNQGIRIISAGKISGIKLSKLPQGLLTRPTLVWQMYTAKEGKQNIQLDYLARDIKWDMNYNAVLSEDDKKLDLVGWVTLANKSGADFPDSKITLVAGEPRRPAQPMFSYGIDYLRSISALSPSTQRGKDISETFGEYHLYRLPNRTSVNAQQIKQIKLLGADSVPVEKIYLYDGAKIQFWPNRTYLEPTFGREANKKVNMLLSLENRADHRLGIALPAGLVRILKRDQDKSLEFIGEDKMPSTSVDEKVLLYIGDAFDLAANRTQTDFRRLSAHSIEEAFKIELKNHKKEPVTIMVIEKLYRWSNWEMIEKSQNYEKINDRTIRFMVTIKPDKTQTIEYRVHYTW
ncbi:MAG: DUF4139 domain-containing protein [Phycisphaerae bacterium]